MKTYLERRPKFFAAQFTSSDDSVQNLCMVLDDAQIKWTVTGCGFDRPTITFHRPLSEDITMTHREYLVRDEAGVVRLLSAREFERQYEVA